jgi:hypothetical protein
LSEIGPRGKHPCSVNNAAVSKIAQHASRSGTLPIGVFLRSIFIRGNSKRALLVASCFTPLQHC